MQTRYIIEKFARIIVVCVLSCAVALSCDVVFADTISSSWTIAQGKSTTIDLKERVPSAQRSGVSSWILNTRWNRIEGISIKDTSGNNIPENQSFTDGDVKIEVSETASGSENIQFTAHYAGGTSDQIIINININQKPIITVTTDGYLTKLAEKEYQFKFLEDAFNDNPHKLKIGFTDPDNNISDLRWYFTVDKKNIVTIPSSGTTLQDIEIRSIAEISGSVNLKLIVKDGLEGSPQSDYQIGETSIDIIVAITGHPDLPKISEAAFKAAFKNDYPEFTITAGCTTKIFQDLKKYVTDPDTPLGNLIWSYKISQTSPLRITQNQDDFTISGRYSGTDTIIFKVSDGQPPVSFPSVKCIVKNPPEITSKITSSVTTAREGVRYTYDVNATDADGNMLNYYYLTAKPYGMTINYTTGVIYWTPNNEQAGGFELSEDHNVVVVAKDGLCKTEPQSFTITVTNVNDPPDIVANKFPNEIKFDEDGSALLSLDSSMVKDVDTKSIDITWSISIGPSDIQYKITNGGTPYTADKNWDVEFTADENWFGNGTVTFTATDADGEKDDYQIGVTVSPVNDLPEIAEGNFPNEVEFDEDKKTSLTLNKSMVTDVESESKDITWSISIEPSDIQYKITNGGAPYTADKNWDVEFTADENWFGNGTVTFTATDADGGKDDYQIDVIVNPVNDPPEIIDNPGNMVVTVHSWKPYSFKSDVLTLSDKVEDVDNTPNEIWWRTDGSEHIVVNISSNYSSATFDLRDSSEIWCGAEDITLSAYNQGDEDNDDKITLTVTVVAPPYIKDLPEMVVVQPPPAKPKPLDLSQYLVACNTVTWNKPINVSSNKCVGDVKVVENQLIFENISPPNSSGGVVEVCWNKIQLTAIDNGLSATGEFAVIIAPDILECDENKQITLVLPSIVNDNVVDCWGLTQKSIVNGMITIDEPLKNRFLITPQKIDCDYDEILSLTCDDIILADDIIIKVSVKNVNDPPRIIKFPSEEWPVSETLNLSDKSLVKVEDADCSQTITWLPAPLETDHVKVEIVNNYVKFTLKKAWCGVETFTFKAEDDGNPPLSSESIELKVLSSGLPIVQLPDWMFVQTSTSKSTLPYIIACDENVDWEFKPENGKYVTPMVENGTLTFDINQSINSSSFGVDKFSYTAKNDYGESAPQDLWALFVPDQLEYDEGQTPTLELLQLPGLTWGLICDPSIFECEKEGDSYRISPKRNIHPCNSKSYWHGNGELLLTATYNGRRETTEVDVIFNPVNNPPEFLLASECFPKMPESISFKEDEKYILYLGDKVWDDDDSCDVLDWYSGDSPHIRMDIDKNNCIATFTSKEDNWNSDRNQGIPETVQLRVTDTAGLKSNILRLKVEVTPVDDPPEITATITEATEDELYTDRVQAKSPDGKSLTYSLTTKPDGMKIDPDTGVITWTPNNNQAGGAESGSKTHDVVVSVADGTFTVTHSFTITVTNVNDPPKILKSEFPDPIQTDENSSKSIVLHDKFEDIDDNLVDIGWRATGDEHIHVAIDSGITIITPEENWTGVGSIELTAIDSGNLSDSQIFIVEVKPIDRPPVILTLKFIEPPIEIPEDTSQSISLFDKVRDDNTPPDIIWWNSPGSQHIHVEFNVGEATFSSKEENWYGEESMPITAGDSRGNLTTEYITVTFISVIEPPEILTGKFLPITINEDEQKILSLVDKVEDDDDEPEEIIWSSDGSEHIGVTINGTQAIFFSREKDWCGQEDVLLTATDSDGESNSVLLSITFICHQDRPVILAGAFPNTKKVGNQYEMTINEDECLTFSLLDKVQDPDTAPKDISWEIQDSDHIEIVVQNNRIATICSKEENWNGTEEIIFIAIDDTNFSDYVPVSVTFTSVPEKPSIKQSFPKVIIVGSSNGVPLDDKVVDDDDAPCDITWEVSGNVHINFQIEQCEAVFSPKDKNWCGEERISLTAIDSEGNKSTPFYVLVAVPCNVNILREKFHQPVTITINEPFELVLSDKVNLPSEKVRWKGVDTSNIHIDTYQNVAGDWIATFTAVNGCTGKGSFEEPINLSVELITDSSIFDTIPLTIKVICHPVITMPSWTLWCTRHNLTRYVESEEEVTWEDFKPTSCLEPVYHNNDHTILDFSIKCDIPVAEDFGYKVTGVDSGLSSSGFITVIALPDVTFIGDGGILEFPLINGKTLTWKAKNKDSLPIDVTVNGNVTTFSQKSEQNWYGVTTVYFEATDNVHTETCHIQVTLKLAPSAPEIQEDSFPTIICSGQDNAPGVEFKNGEFYSLALSDKVKDKDTPLKELEWSHEVITHDGGQGNIQVQLLGDVAIFGVSTQDSDWGGTEWVKLTVTDKDDLSDSILLCVHVIGPMLKISVPCWKLWHENMGWWDLTKSVDDPNVTWEFEDSENIHPIVDGNRVKFEIKTPEWRGAETVSYTVKNTNRQSAPGSVTVVVIPSEIKFDFDKSYELSLTSEVRCNDTLHHLKWDSEGTDNIKITKRENRIIFEATSRCDVVENVSLTATDIDSVPLRSETIFTRIIVDCVANSTEPNDEHGAPIIITENFPPEFAKNNGSLELEMKKDSRPVNVNLEAKYEDGSVPGPGEIAWTAESSENVDVTLGGVEPIATFTPEGATDTPEVVKLTVTDKDGRSDTVFIAVNVTRPLPPRPELLANFPNPFNPGTWIPYRLAEDADVKIEIYNQKGQLIHSIDLGPKTAGNYDTKNKAAYWDGRSNVGERVARGIYFYTLKANSFSATRKMLVRRTAE